MYDLQIDGDNHGFQKSLDTVWEYIDGQYKALPDQYEGVVQWEIFNTSTGQFCNQKMEAGLWYAYAESPRSFCTWLKLFGWEEAQTQQTA